MISEEIRKNIIDALSVGEINCAGEKDYVVFLSRIFDLKSLRSTDYRFKNAEDDIKQHRIRNCDWDDNWIYSDLRFDLLHCPEDIFKKFICEMVHPVIRDDPKEVYHLVELFNKYLARDQLEMRESESISNKPIFDIFPRITNPSSIGSAKEISIELNEDYLRTQIKRMEDEIEPDPELAIGTAKEFIETICKTILQKKGETYENDEKVHVLFKKTLKKLKIVPDGVREPEETTRAIEIILGNLNSIVVNLRDLRNQQGTGHGKAAFTRVLDSRHAKLAVGAASTLGVFIFETYKEESHRYTDIDN